MKQLLLSLLCITCLTKCSVAEMEVEDPLDICITIDDEPFSQSVLASIPYRSNGQRVYRISDGTTSTVPVRRVDTIRHTTQRHCQHEVKIELGRWDGTTAFRARGRMRKQELLLRYLLQLGQGSQVLTVDVILEDNNDDAAVLEAAMEGQRIIADTVIEGRSYRHVLVSTFSDFDIYNKVFYTAEQGFIRLERPNGLTISLVE